MFCRILPTYSKTAFVKVNLAEEAKHRFDLSFGKESPMKDSRNQDLLLKAILQDYKNPCYGGFMEDRSELWRGFENSKKIIHLGIDINNLLPGTPVTTPMKAVVVHACFDDFKFNGWGGRIILYLQTPYLGCNYLMYGHLAHANLPLVGTTFDANDIVGYVGNVKENGGWFCHLHVQLITDFHFNLYRNNLHDLDRHLLDFDFPLVGEYSRDPTGLIFR